MDTLIDAFANVQAALYEYWLQPLAFALGLGNRLEDVFNGTGWLLVGLIQWSPCSTPTRCAPM